MFVDNDSDRPGEPRPYSVVDNALGDDLCSMVVTACDVLYGRIDHALASGGEAAVRELVAPAEFVPAAWSVQISALEVDLVVEIESRARCCLRLAGYSGHSEQRWLDGASWLRQQSHTGPGRPHS